MTVITETPTREVQTPVERDEVSQILERAALYLEEFGWVQGQTGSTGTGFCLVGAICFAGGYRWRHMADGRQLETITVVLGSTACQAVERVADIVTPGLATWRAMVGVPAWNDQPGRDRAQVIDVLRQAARR